MKIHLVGGFLGSGKTTAIINAANSLMRAGQKVGVVTNDQGKYLVDTHFIASQDIPAVEVTQGCFCCNYEGLEDKLAELDANEKPDVVFAESVGSCGDLVATVIKPLLELEGSNNTPTSFSVFTDSRLLLAHLQGIDLPFSENVVYIFEKQIEEGKLLIINKADLLSQDERTEIETLAKAKYTDKTIWLQNSKNVEDVNRWLTLLETHPNRLATDPIKMDYQRYGDGEMQLAWLDQEWEITSTPLPVGLVVSRIIEEISHHLHQQALVIGHLKFFVSAAEKDLKISIPTWAQDDWKPSLAVLNGPRAKLLINARVEVAPETLRAEINRIIQEISNTPGITIVNTQSDAFKPGFPNPTHRIAG